MQTRDLDMVHTKGVQTLCQLMYTPWDGSPKKAHALTGCVLCTTAQQLLSCGIA